MYIVRVVEHGCNEIDEWSMVEKPTLHGTVLGGTIRWTTHSTHSKNNPDRMSLKVKFCPACGEELPTNAEYVIGLADHREFTG